MDTRYFFLCTLTIVSTIFCTTLADGQSYPPTPYPTQAPPAAPSSYSPPYYPQPTSTHFVSSTAPTWIDSDNDGLGDAYERSIGCDPLNRDSDGDGFNDGYEVLTSHTNPTNSDTDGDGVSDFDELSTNPNNPDTDGDGYSDGEERAIGSDPLAPWDPSGYPYPVPTIELPPAGVE